MNQLIEANMITAEATETVTAIIIRLGFLLLSAFATNNHKQKIIQCISCFNNYRIK